MVCSKSASVSPGKPTIMSLVMEMSRCGGVDPAHALEVPVAGVLAGHGLEDGGGAGLDGKVDVVAEGGGGVDRLDDVAGEVAGVRGGEADALDAGDVADGGEEFGEGELPDGSRQELTFWPRSWISVKPGRPSCGLRRGRRRRCGSALCRGCRGRRSRRRTCRSLR